MSAQKAKAESAKMQQEAHLAVLESVRESERGRGERRGVEIGTCTGAAGED